MTRGRRKNERLEQRRRERTSLSLRRTYRTRKRKVSKAQINRWNKVNIGRTPWNKGKTVEKDGIYPPNVIRNMCFSKRRRWQRQQEQ